MNEALKQALEQHKKDVVEVIAAQLNEIVPNAVSQQVKDVVAKMSMDRAVFGKDITGLSTEEKTAFVEFAKAVAFGRTKANEALIVEDQSRGGYLVPVGVHRGILRIAEAFGVVMNQAQKFDLKGVSELDIPAYTGAVLQGEYLGVDVAGSATALAFEQAKLLKKTWQLAFAINNTLFRDAVESLADFLMTLVAEALANQVDKQGLSGTGAPYVGVLNDADVAVITMGAGNTDFEDFDLEDASDMIASVPKGARKNGVFIFSSTVWARIRVKKDGAGNYLLPQAGAPGPAVLKMFPELGGFQVEGELMGRPVFTDDNLPALSATAISTKFGIFGSLRDGLAFGDAGPLTMEEHRSGSFGGKEVALANQRGMVAKHDHAVAVSNPEAFVIIKTAAA
jgi:HK97 family phage major capsid protein